MPLVPLGTPCLCPATEKKPSQPKKRVKVKQSVTVVKPPVLTSTPAVQVPVSVPIAVPATEEWPIPVNPKAALHTVLAGILSKRDCTQPISLKEIRIQAEKELGSSLAECRDDIKDFASQFLDAALARNASAAGGPPASSPADYAAQQHSASGTDSDSSSSDATADFSRPKTVSGPVFFGFANPIVQQGIRSKPDIAEALRTLDPTVRSTCRMLVLTHLTNCLIADDDP